MSRVQRNRELYDVVRKWYAIVPPLVMPVTMFINAPFGRFALKKDAWLQFDGIKSWIIMELVSPLSFLFSMIFAPLNPHASSMSLSLSDPRTILSFAFLTHYANRALLSPLRTPSRSKAHISVTMSGVLFNLINGSLMGTYLSSPEAEHFLVSSSSSTALGRPTFYIGLVVWALGFAGNILHDEILLRLRRGAIKKSDDGKEHYAIPYGYLYKFISYPNYFCEWVEWFGFAFAAAPLSGLFRFTKAPPPWLFLLAEVFVMFPRAYRGHQWYHRKFPNYPKERKAVVPFVI